MTKDEFKKAVEIAKSQEDLTQEDIGIFHGYALPDFQQVHCTLRGVARLIRWQCLQLDGNMNAEELDNLAYCARRRFLIVG